MAKAHWAVLVYISADEILTNFAVDSLKQLKLGSSESVVVEAQVDANGKRPIRRYRFGGKPETQLEKEESIKKNETVFDNPNRLGIADPQNLTDFIDSVAYDLATNEPIAESFCIVPWGHGVELLLDEDRLRIREGRDLRVNRRYLTPANLRKGLEGTRLFKSGRKFDIIGLDACSMSMLELASELQNCANFMVASQEDVPDVSFPYEKILKGLTTIAGGNKMEAKEVSKTIADLYLQTYRDYISAPGSGVRGITLASMNLGQVKTVTGPLTKLAKAMLGSHKNDDLGRAISDARSKSRNFVFGLFVDLFDFCEKLGKALESTNLSSQALSEACGEIRQAIQVQDGGCVVRNATKNGGDSHGLSIYFPYRDDMPTDAFQVLQALGPGPDERPVKGGNRPLKGGNRPLKERNARIAEIEEDFQQLRFFPDTKWLKFIQEDWCRILAKLKPDELDIYYSGQQCAKNLAA